MPHSVAKEESEDDESTKKRKQNRPRAGDSARQIGVGFFKMADVIDECPPLAKLFEGGFLERRFQKVFQLPRPALAATPATCLLGVRQEEDDKARGGVDDDVARSEHVLTGPSRCGPDGNDTAPVSTRAHLDDRPSATARQQYESGVVALGMCSSSNDSGSDSGRRCRDKQRLRSTDDDVLAASGSESEPTAPKKGKYMEGAGARGRLSQRRANKASSGRSRKKSPPVSLGHGFVLAPPPRRAAEAALHRMASLASSRVPPVRSTKTSAAPAAQNDQNATSGNGKPLRKDQRQTRAGTGGTGAATTTQKYTRLAESGCKRTKKGGPTAGVPERVPVDGFGRTIDVECDGANGRDTRRQRRTEADTPLGLDRRVFRYFPAGKCKDGACTMRSTEHCHRGPACDCIIDSETSVWPDDIQTILHHQEKHSEWNSKPKFGKRVMVESEDGRYYSGTINTDGNSARDRRHRDGRWGVLFDDYTRGRFHDGAHDVMMSSRPRPMVMSAKMRDFYLRQENGRRLLVGVAVIDGPDARGQSQDDSTRKTQAQQKRSSPGPGSTPETNQANDNGRKKNSRRSASARTPESTPGACGGGGSASRPKRKHDDRERQKISNESRSATEIADTASRPLRSCRSLESYCEHAGRDESVTTERIGQISGQGRAFADGSGATGGRAQIPSAEGSSKSQRSSQKEGSTADGTSHSSASCRIGAEEGIGAEEDDANGNDSPDEGRKRREALGAHACPPGVDGLVDQELVSSSTADSHVEGAGDTAHKEHSQAASTNLVATSFGPADILSPPAEGTRIEDGLTDSSAPNASAVQESSEANVVAPSSIGRPGEDVNTRADDYGEPLSHPGGSRLREPGGGEKQAKTIEPELINAAATRTISGGSVGGEMGQEKAPGRVGNACASQGFPGGAGVDGGEGSVRGGLAMPVPSTLCNADPNTLAVARVLVSRLAM